MAQNMGHNWTGAINQTSGSNGFSGIEMKQVVGSRRVYKENWGGKTALALAALVVTIACPVPARGETIFADGFESGRICWIGGPTVGDLDLCFDMPFGTPPPVAAATVQAAANIPQVDLIFGLDTTGSMGGEIANLKSSASAILDEFLIRIPGGAVGVAGYDDYPYDPYGSLADGDRAFYLLHRAMTATTAAGKASIMSAIDAFSAQGGGDGPESGWEMVYQVSSGAGSGSGIYAVPEFDPATAPPVLIPEGESVGDSGGAGLRAGALPVLIWITDESSHNSSATDSFYGAIPGVVPSTSSQALAAMNQIGGRIIGVMSGENARLDLTLGVNSTGSHVPADAWGTSARPPGCGLSQCCTGVNGTGVPPVSGFCPLVFEISPDGSGLGTAVVDGIERLVTSVSSDIGADLLDDPNDDVDAVAAFAEKLVADDTAAPECTQGLTTVDTNSDGEPDTYLDVQPGANLCFTLVLKANNTVPTTGIPQFFSATLEILADAVVIVETRSVHFRVPP